MGLSIMVAMGLGLALGVAAEVVRRPFGTRAAAAVAAVSSGLALAWWIADGADARSLMLFGAFCLAFYMTNLFELQERRTA